MNDTHSSPGPGEGGEKEPPTHYGPLMAITGFFAAVFIFVPLFVRKGPNRPIIRCCIMMGAFCMWILWATIYIEQMNPIMGPRLRNSTVAWIAHKYGNPVSPSSLDEP